MVVERQQQGKIWLFSMSTALIVCICTYSWIELPSTRGSIPVTMTLVVGPCMRVS